MSEYSCLSIQRLPPCLRSDTPKLMISNFSVSHRSLWREDVWVRWQVCLWSYEYGVKGAWLDFPEQAVKISQYFLGDLVGRKSSRGAAWHLLKTTSQSPCSNPPSPFCDGGIYETGSKQSQIKHPLRLLVQWAVTSSCLPTIAVFVYLIQHSNQESAQTVFRGCLMVLELMVVSSG